MSIKQRAMRIQFTQVHPVLPCKDVTAAVAFYCNRLGFTLRGQDSAENPRYAVVNRDQVELHLQWHDPATFDHTVEKPMLRFPVADIDRLFIEYEAKDVFHAQTALRNTAWGTREFAFYDPNMNGLTFYTTDQ